MISLTDDFDFSSLSDEELETLLASEREKRKHLAPTRAKIPPKGKVSGEKTSRAPKKTGPEYEEVEIDD